MKKLQAAAQALVEAVESVEATEKDTKGLLEELKLELNKLPPLDAQEVNAALHELRDILSKGWNEEALKYVEGLLKDDPSLGRPMQQLPYIAAFEQAFKTACRKHNVVAAFVIIESEDVGDNKKKYKLLTGGMHVADAILSYHLKPLAESLGQDLNPQKAFLNIEKIEQRNPVHTK